MAPPAKYIMRYSIIKNTAEWNSAFPKASIKTEYITNSDNPIFSDLSSMGANDDSGNGIGNITADQNNSGSSVATTSGSQSSTDMGQGIDADGNIIDSNISNIDLKYKVCLICSQYKTSADCS